MSDDYRKDARRIRESVTQPAIPRTKKPAATILLRHCIYCAAPTINVVCAAHQDLLGDLEAER